MKLKIFRKDKIFVAELERFVPCSEDQEHFIWELPKNQVGPTYQCTCGSVAVMTGYSGYKDNASQQGLMFVCLHHASFGIHATGGSRWI